MSVIKERQPRTTRPRLSNELAAPFKDFKPTAPAGEPGGLPDGWVLVDSFLVPFADGNLPLATQYVLTDGQAWAMAKSGLRFAENEEDEPEWETGEVQLLLTSTSIGSIADVLRSRASSRYFLTRAERVLYTIIGPALPAGDPVGLLLSLEGDISDLELPEVCFDPMFASPVAAPLTT